MKDIDPKVQRIIAWRENFATLPDNHFFELIRMYLGEIHTPFNKSKLVEELGAFLRKEENRKTIVSLLSESDIQIIAAVWYIPNATQEKVAAFFAGSYNFAAIYEHLLNLEERLILYRHGDKQTGKTIISVNPMLEDVLQPFLTPSALFPPAVCQEPNSQQPQPVSPELLAAFVSFVFSNPDLCKADGSFKKRAVTLLEKRFPEKLALLQTLAAAFINLSLLKDTEEGLVPDMARLQAFAALDEQAQYAYLCVAAQGRFSRTALVRQARLLLELVEEVGRRPANRTGLLRLAFLISEKDNDIPGVAPMGATSRFASILQRARLEENSLQPEDVVSLVDRMIDGAVLLGILEETGKDAAGESIYVQGAVMTASPRPRQPPYPPVLTIDAGFSVTLLPGLPFSALLPLSAFMEIVQFDTAAVFEITKKSVMGAFDRGIKQEQILSLLGQHCPYEVPQNLRVTVDDWSSAYNSAGIYKGYILRVSPENSAALQRNRAIAPHIAEILAPGIFLLDVQTDEQAEALVAKSGLDFIGSIKSAGRQPEVAAFPRLFLREAGLPQEAEAVGAALPEAGAADDHLAAMTAALSQLPLSPEQKEGLQDRIQRKIVLTASQLRGDSVRLERIEAGGMDYSGKLHIIDSAISSNSMVELAYENPNDPAGESIMVVGTPLGLEKLDGDSLLRIELIPQHEEKLFSVGKARLVKRIRGSVLR